MRKVFLFLVCLLALAFMALAFGFYLPIWSGGEQVLIGDFVLDCLSLSQFKGNAYIQSIVISLVWIFAFLFGYLLNNKSRKKFKKKPIADKILRKIAEAKKQDELKVAESVQSAVAKPSPTVNRMSVPSKFKRVLPKDK